MEHVVNSLVKKVQRVSVSFVARSFLVLLIMLGLLASSAALAAQSSDSWEQVVAAAKKEGAVSVIGPQGTEVSDALTLAFQKKYPEIKVDIQNMSGSRIAPKVLAELAAGRNSTDLLIGGTSTMLGAIIPAKAAVPVKPWLTGPNTQDQSKWRGGKMKFADDAGIYNLVMSQYVKPPFVINTKQISANEFKSWKDSLDPKWHGKIVLRDPLIAGAGMTNAQFWYVTESLGKDYIRKMLTQTGLTILRDDGQILDSCAQGKYPVVIGPGDSPTNQYIAKGLPITQQNPASLKESTYVTAGNGSLTILRDAPHPNALRVYLDFLLSAEGQLAWSKGVGFASLRRGVPRDHVPDIFVPKDGVDYPDLSSEKYDKIGKEVGDFLKSVMNR